MTTWGAGTGDPSLRLGPRDWFRIARRGLPLVTVVLGGLGLHLALRLIERPLFGPARPMTPRIAMGVSRAAIALIGMDYRVTGRPMEGQGAVVANHVSWLDIFALNACQQVYFVAKEEVAGWPLVGWLARATGTVFIRRDRRDAAHQKALLEDRLRAGHRLLFFPEGTSTDGLRVLDFKPTLFAAFFAEGLGTALRIQPVSVVYRPRASKGASEGAGGGASEGAGEGAGGGASEGAGGAAADFYGWWGEMSFAPNLLKILAAPRHGAAEVTFHDPVAVQDFADRKALARHCERAVRGALKRAGDPPP